MAGIGFELKKIYKQNTVAAHIKGGFYSVFVTIGHVLITIGVLMGTVAVAVIQGVLA